MGVFHEIERFVQSHRTCGILTWQADTPTPEGYGLWLTCPCGALFGAWVTAEAAEDDLLYSYLLAFPN